jgi:hypothetical protein
LSACAITAPAPQYVASVRQLSGATTAEPATATPEAEAGSAAAASSAATDGAEGATTEAATDPRVVDLNKASPAEADNSGLVCREMLRPNSNQIVNVCGTPAQWKKYQAAEAEAAEKLVLKMQFQHIH